MNLREEIYDIIEDAMYFRDKKDDINLFVNKVIKQIEKRVNEVFEDIKIDMIKFKDEGNENLYIDESIKIHHIMRLKEMLK